MNDTTKIIKLSDIVENININEADEKLDLNMDKLLDASKDLAKAAGDKTWAIVKALGKALGKAVSSYAADKSGDLIDELLLGQFKPALISIFKAEKLTKLDDTESQKMLEELLKDAKFKTGTERSKLDSRKDEETSVDIDDTTLQYLAAWYSKDKDLNIAKQLSQLVAEIQLGAKDLEDEQKQLSAKLKSLKIDVTEDDLKNFGPILQKAIADGESKEDIAKTLKKLKSEVKESYDSLLEEMHKTTLLTESKFILTEDIKQKILVESLLYTDEFKSLIAQLMINEGFLSKALKVAAGAAAGAVVYKLLPQKVQTKVKDFGEKTIKLLTNKTLAGLVSLGGMTISAFTGGWGAMLALKAIYAVERHGKVLRNSFERMFTTFANSKGVIAEMRFQLKDKKDSKYAMRFYTKDMVWRVLNLKDLLKHPGKEYSKKIVTGKEGKKFTDRLAAIWDPLFGKEKGGKIDFVELFKQSKNILIPEKALKMYQDFATSYDKIRSSCIETPKVDTRTQTLSKDTLDK